MANTGWEGKDEELDCAPATARGVIASYNRPSTPRFAHHSWSRMWSAGDWRKTRIKDRTTRTGGATCGRRTRTKKKAKRNKGGARTGHFPKPVLGLHSLSTYYSLYRCKSYHPDRPRLDRRRPRTIIGPERKKSVNYVTINCTRSADSGK